MTEQEIRKSEREVLVSLLESNRCECDPEATPKHANCFFNDMLDWVINLINSRG